jgi:hypothetical protein
MKKLIPFLALLILAGCNKEEITRGSELDAPIITGFNFIDPLGNPLATIGSPNSLNSVKKNGEEFTLLLYPNPTNPYNGVNVHFQRTGGSRGPKKVWLVAGRTESNDPQFNFATSNPLVIGGQPLITIENIGPASSTIHLNLSGLPAGAYRVYAQYDDVLLWDNLLLQK